MTSVRRAAPIGVFAALVSVAALPAPARAQSVEADVLFREGKKLLKAGKIAEACDKLEASERLESSVGTLLNLGDCRERNHQLATAWETFRKAARTAKVARDGKREAEARRREKLLAPRLSYLTIEVPADSQVDGLAITRDGAELHPQLWNQTVPIDPGSYELAASAAGHFGWSRRVQINGDAQRISVRVPALDPRPPPPVAPPAAASPPRERPAERRPAPVSPSRLTGTRTVALAVAAIGAAGIGAGIGFGVHGNRLEQDSDALCPMVECNDARGLSLNADARRAARNANIGFAAGGAVLGAAIVLWIVGAPHAVAPDVAGDRVGVAVAGRF